MSKANYFLFGLGVGAASIVLERIVRAGRADREAEAAKQPKGFVIETVTCPTPKPVHKAGGIVGDMFEADRVYGMILVVIQNMMEQKLADGTFFKKERKCSDSFKVIVTDQYVEISCCGFTVLGMEKRSGGTYLRMPGVVVPDAEASAASLLGNLRCGMVLRNNASAGRIASVWVSEVLHLWWLHQLQFRNSIMPPPTGTFISLIGNPRWL